MRGYMIAYVNIKMFRKC